MRILMVVSALAVAGPAVAVEDVDGSLAHVPGKQRTELLELLDRTLFDAPAARLRGIKPMVLFTDNMCGWVNAKNQYGAYVGYRRFVISFEPRHIAVDNGGEPSLGPDEILLSRGKLHCKE